jgi:hypothetical protein
VSIGAIYYNVNTRKIEDPLNAIDDFRKGIIKACDISELDFEVIRIFKMSAEYSMKLNDDIDEYLKTHAKEIILSWSENNIEFNYVTLALVFKDVFSPKVWKLLYDYDLMDIFMGPKYDVLYNNKEKSKIKNKIFNIGILSYYISENCIYSCNFSPLEKFYFYKKSFPFVLGDFSKFESTADEFNKGKSFTEKLSDQNFILFSCYLYCKNFDCEQNIFRQIDMEFIKGLIKELKILNKN